MRVGIVTFHDGINHGAFFQAFFLQEYLKKIGFDAHIINYKNRHHWYTEYRAFLWTRSPGQLIRNVRKIRSFRRDQNLLSLEPRKLTLRPRVARRVSRKFDYIVVGSDIVWAWDVESLGGDRIYFGEGLRPRRDLISYAASMGPSGSRLPPEHVVEGLSNFDRISVRDDNTKDVVERLSPIQAVKVVDPTLLMGLADVAIPIEGVSNGRPPYLLVYAYVLNDGWKSAIEKFASDRGLEIVVAGYPQRMLAFNKTDVGPIAWLSLFSGADYVVTSTFHGTIFSILCRKKFLTIANPPIENKVVSLLKDLELLGRYSRANFGESEMEQTIDWEAVHNRVECLRKASQNFLKQALGVVR